jgi:hypothetical protein
LAGIGDHPWPQPVADRGIAVAQLDGLAEATDPRIEWAVAAWGLGADAARRMSTSFACATDGRVKLFRGSGAEWLYDLAEDPLERRARAVTAEAEVTYGAALPPLRAALDRAAGAERSTPPGERANSNGPPTDTEIAGLEDRMRLLGYL